MKPVASYMIGAPLSAAADAPAHQAKVLMAKKGIHHVLLVEPDGRLSGLVTHTDLLGLRGGGADVHDRDHCGRPGMSTPWPWPRTKCGAGGGNCSPPAWGSRHCVSGCPGSTT